MKDIFDFLVTADGALIYFNFAGSVRKVDAVLCATLIESYAPRRFLADCHKTTIKYARAKKKAESASLPLCDWELLSHQQPLDPLLTVEACA